MTSLREIFFNGKGMNINPLARSLLEGEGFDNNISDDFGDINQERDDVSIQPTLAVSSPPTSTIGGIVNVAFDIYHSRMYQNGAGDELDYSFFKKELTKWIYDNLKDKNKRKLAYKVINKYIKYFDTAIKANILGQHFTDWYIENIENTAIFNAPI